jgi:thioesterase domain-containing protein
MVTHANIARLFTATDAWFHFSPQDIWTLFHSYAFDFSVWEIWGPLLYGGRLVVVPKNTARSPEDFYKLICKEGVTVLNQTPSAFRQLSAVQAKSADRHQLRFVIFGGEALDLVVLRPWYERNSDSRPQLVNMYGITETTVHVTYRPLDKDDIEMRGPSPIGRPIPDLQVYILDAYGEPVPVGVDGELYVAGAGVARGYLNRSELTAERFLQNPFSFKPGVRMYRTGDLGRWLPDGNIDFLGRNDSQVKIRGFRIELGEIEARLTEYPSVNEVAVILREDVPGDKRLVAYYSSSTSSESGDHAVLAEQLRSHLAKSVPDYMLPAAYVHLNSLPLTSNGKLDHRALPAPESDAYSTRRYEPPQNEIETKLARIWAEVLKLDRVGRYDNFFELGGHSLLTLRTIAMLQQEGIHVSAADIFAHSTVHSLSTEIGARAGQVLADSAILMKSGGSETPIFLPHCGAGELVYVSVLAQWMNCDAPIYGLPPQSAATPLQSIEGMATRMVHMIRAVQPVGPYRIVGYSFGGVLAYEIAAQLLGADQPVEFLGILDTNYSAGSDDPADDIWRTRDECDILLMLCENEANVAGRMQDAMEEVIACASAADFDAFVQLCKQEDLIPEYLRSHSCEQLKRTILRMKSYQVAGTHYFPQPISIPLMVFATRHSMDLQPTLGWNAVVPDRMIHIIPIPGTHRSMMLAPNVDNLGRKLADEIRNLRGGAPEGVAALPDGRYESIVKLRSGLSKVTPLFCVPGAGASVTSFIDLDAELVTEWPVYGLQPRGLDGAQAPHATVSAAAEFYLREIEALDLPGPFHLLGHSLGGWIVFEMAQRLMKAGGSVASLTILDSEAPDDGYSTVREYTDTDVAWNWVKAIENMLGHSIGIQIAELQSRSQLERRELLHSSLVSNGIMSPRSSADDLRGPLRTFASGLRTYYMPCGPYYDPVRLIFVEDHGMHWDAIRENPELQLKRWRRWAPNLAYITIPGNHMTVLKQPYVRTLARLLSLNQTPAMAASDMCLQTEADGATRHLESKGRDHAKSGLLSL